MRYTFPVYFLFGSKILLTVNALFYFFAQIINKIMVGCYSSFAYIAYGFIYISLEGKFKFRC